MIVDPGQDAEPGLEELLRQYRLQPVAVLLTHGHIDHIWSVAPVCGAARHPGLDPPGGPGAARRPGRGLAQAAGHAALRRR